MDKMQTMTDIDNSDNQLENKNTTYTIPERKLVTVEELHRFETSETRQEFLTFIADLNQSVKGKKLSDQFVLSPVCKKEGEKWVGGGGKKGGPTGILVFFFKTKFFSFEVVFFFFKFFFFFLLFFHS